MCLRYLRPTQNPKSTHADIPAISRYHLPLHDLRRNLNMATNRTSNFERFIMLIIPFAVFLGIAWPSLVTLAKSVTPPDSAPAGCETQLTEEWPDPGVPEAWGAAHVAEQAY